MKVSIGKYPKKGERKIKIQIDPWDTWNLDHTLALIILPALKQLKEQKPGAPDVDNEDVPEELRSDNHYPENGTSTDDHWHERWDYVIDEMIFSFDKLVNDDWEDEYFTNGFNKEGYTKFNERIENGLRLFGKYFRGLWT